MEYNLYVILLLLRIYRIFYYQYILSDQNFIDLKHIIYDLFFSYIMYHVFNVLLKTDESILNLFIFDSVATLSLLSVYSYILNKNNEIEKKETFQENEKAKIEVTNYKENIKNEDTLIKNLEYKPQYTNITYPDRTVINLILVFPYFLLLI